MEVYILDDLLRRDVLVDRFESLIWTERYQEMGDFQLTLYSSGRSRTQFVEGTHLAINQSKRVMIVENVENKIDSEGRSILSVSGRSLESILEDRAAKATLEGLEVEPEFVWPPETPGNLLRALFNYICVQGQLSPLDIIPMYQAGSLYPPNTLLEPEIQITMSFEPQSLYSQIKKVCEAYGLGFRMYRGLDDSKIYFNIYSGDDRTSIQMTKSAVIFSNDLENLSDVSELRTIQNHKNVALVISKFGTRWVYANDEAITATGRERRVVVVTASDIELEAGVELDEALEARGLEELKKYKAVKAIDGELSSNSKYTYGVDYELGDLVEMRNDDGLTNRMRIVEQIFVDDVQGERAYPTLSADEFITPGSWNSWDFNSVWDTAIGEWNDLP